MYFILEKQEPTVYNALHAIPRYIEKYGLLDAYLNLFYNFHLRHEELDWIIDKSYAKGYIDDEGKKRVIQYTKELR